jgi:hypothetical protein
MNQSNRALSYCPPYIGGGQNGQITSQPVPGQNGQIRTIGTTEPFSPYKRVPRLGTKEQNLRRFGNVQAKVNRTPMLGPNAARYGPSLPSPSLCGSPGLNRSCSPAIIPGKPAAKSTFKTISTLLRSKK